MKIVRTDSNHGGLPELIGLLDTYLSEINGEKDNFFKAFNSYSSIPYFVVAQEQSGPIGCGALKPFDDKTLELKRMYVKPEVRGTGVARLILADLEDWAVELGFSSIILETSKSMKPAVSFYQKSGYGLTDNYGQYVDVDTSVCMIKHLVRSVG